MKFLKKCLCVCYIQSTEKWFKDIQPKTPKNSSHLVDIMQSNDSIKECVEVIEQVDHLDGFAESWDGGEAHDVTEVQSDLAEMLGFDGLACLQCLSHRPEGGRWWVDDGHQRFNLISTFTVIIDCKKTKWSLLKCNDSPLSICSEWRNTGKHFKLDLI